MILGLGITLALVVMTGVGPVAAVPRVGLGTAAGYAVLAGSTVTNTGPSVINGNLGVSPGSAVTGFPPGLVNGEIHAADAPAGIAQNDLTIAYNDAAGRPTDVTITADLAGQTLTPGVYTGATLALNGQLTLDGANETDPVFIFQAASTLITGSSSSIVFINGADACDVYWQVGSSATLGTATAFAGTVMALTSITATTGVTVQGRLLARNGAVTLDTNTITVPTCIDEPEPTEPEPTEPEPTEPQPTEPQPTEPEPTEPQPTEPQPTEPQPTEPQPTEPQPTEPQPTEPQPTEPQPTEPQPTEPQPTEPQPTEPQPTEPQPTEPQPTEPQPTEPQPTEPQPTESQPTEPQPTEPQPTEPQPTEPQPTEPQPTEPQPTEPQPTEPSDGQIKTWPVGGVQTGGSPAGGMDALMLAAGLLAIVIGLGGLVMTRSTGSHRVM
ncbi:ice-binding family protein [Ornithinimicrobium cerasi]|uniref:ice-binding family protein n=1 Tax=Ornithinimicrobium cerasi TaxID=2248773 RepID=UPI001F3A7B3D|nr:ice-binding family protein [Ornithinimicrobium cerasi]